MGNNTAPTIAFRTLASDEICKFVQWARDNNTPEHRAKAGLYHPTVRAEWARLDAIANHPTTKAIEYMRYGANHAGQPGKFPSYGWPGGYTLIYITEDGGTLCGECVNGMHGSEVGSDDAVYDDGTSDPQWTVTGAHTYDEGPVTYCDHCDADIESSYGDPNAPEIKLDNMDRDDGTVLVTCDDSSVKDEHHSVSGSSWEAPSDMSGAYAVICDEPGLVAKLEREGYQVDTAEYCEPETKEDG